MQIEERNAGDVVVLKVVGDITMGTGDDEKLRDKVVALMDGGHLKLVLDLGGVAYMDSSGLGQLIQVHTMASRKGGALKLLHATKRLKDLLVVTKLLLVFDAFDTEQEVLASFAAPSGT
jgi:anti-sigma B factor antagonist